MKIASLDFETANVFQGSVCSVGVALFEDGKLIRTMDQRIMPHSDCRYFNPELTLIHGIRLRDVIGAPEFPAVADELFGLLQGAFVIAHNAAFDINVLRTVCELYGIRYPEIEYFCTCKAARRLWKQLENHKLNTLCRYIGHDFRHHDAAEDAVAAGNVFLAMMESAKCNTPYELANYLQITPGRFDGLDHIPCRCKPLRKTRKAVSC